MAVPHTVNGSQWEELDGAEMADELDAQAKRLFGMPLEEFLDKRRTGELPSSPASDYLALASGDTRPGRD